MKRVKAIGAFQYDMTPDAALDRFKKRLEELFETNLENHDRLLLKGTGYSYKIVKPGEIVDIPNHAYDAFKNATCDIPVSFGQFNKQGAPVPFDLSQAKKFGLTDTDKTLKRVKVIELIEDLDTIAIPQSKDDKKNILKK